MTVLLLFYLKQYWIWDSLLNQAHSGSYTIMQQSSNLRY